MAYEQREGQGSLFPNDKKGNEKAPNSRGTLLLGGTLYELSGWTKTRENGEKWISIQAKPKAEGR